MAIFLTSLSDRMVAANADNHNSIYRQQELLAAY
jgi:hypothetical protein